MYLFQYMMVRGCKCPQGTDLSGTTPKVVEDLLASDIIEPLS